MNRCLDTLPAMRAPGFVASSAGVVGALVAHTLDQSGLLPGVHETVAVRTAMGLWPTLVWLAVAGAFAWAAARTRPLVVGAPAAVLVAACPELVGRHDLGAIVEPGALAGAALQWLLVMAVVAALVVVQRYRAGSLSTTYVAITWPRAGFSESQHSATHVGRRGRPRAPPRTFLSAHT